MNILFDLSIKFPGFYDDCSIEEKMALDTILFYISNRLTPLYDEIDFEESRDESPKAIIIFLMGNQKAIQPRGYSKELSDKIVNSFNENDAILLFKSVDDSLKRLLN